jgi:hypothetical protein
MVVLSLSACTTTPPPPRAPSLGESYRQAHDQHFGAAYKWIDAVSRYTSCLKTYSPSPEMAKCKDVNPDPAEFLPKDRLKDETLNEYWERKNDEWQDRECFYQGLFNGQTTGEMRRIEQQCKATVETIRLRKAVEKLSKDKSK